MNTETQDQNPATAELQAVAGGITSVPDQFIKVMNEGLTATAVHNALMAGALSPVGATALHEDMKVHDLEHLQPYRRRARGFMTTAYVAPFAQYATAYHEPGAAVFVDAEHMAATAVLDLGTKESPVTPITAQSWSPSRQPCIKPCWASTAAPRASSNWPSL